MEGLTTSQLTEIKYWIQYRYPDGNTHFLETRNLKKGIDIIEKQDDNPLIQKLLNKTIIAVFKVKLKPCLKEQ